MTDQQNGDNSDDIFGGMGDSDGLDDFNRSSFPPMSDPDLPDTLEPVEAQGPNRTFVLGLVLLVIVVVIGLIAIVFAAVQTGQDNANRSGTTTAIVGTNNAVMTSIAGTATAKSYTLTPSNTPSPTRTPTSTPSNTPTLTITPSPSPTATNEPGVTPPTETLTPPPSPVTNTTNIQAITTQNAILQAAQTVFAVQETRNAPSAGDTRAIRIAKQTQSAGFAQAQTPFAAQLTANAIVLTTGSSSVNNNGTSGSATPTPSDTPSSVDASGASGAAITGVPANSGAAGTNAGTATPAAPTQIGTLTPTVAGMIAPVLNSPSDRAAQYGNTYPILNIRQPANQPIALAAFAQDTAAPAVTLPSAVDATLSPALLNATATAAFLNGNTTQLQLAQTALAGQLTANAALSGISTPGLIETSSAQIQMGQTAVAVQLNSDANALSTLNAATQVPRTGLYEDLAAGRAAPGSLALLGLAAIGLVGLIVAARRLRVKF